MSSTEQNPIESHDMPGHLIRRMHQVSTQTFQKRVHQVGLDLTPVQFAALQAIQSYPSVDQARIAALVGYDRATIGGVIERLEHKGFVHRVVSSSDRRAREVRLSEAGGVAINQLLPVVRELQAEILKNLSLQERATFTALAKKALGMETE